MNVSILTDFPVFDSATSANAYPGLLAQVFKLYTQYWAADTWNSVLELHTPESREYIQSIGMQESWEQAHAEKPHWTATYSAVMQLGDLETFGVVFTQSVPIRATPEQFSTFEAFSADGFRVQAQRWKFDATLQLRPVAQLIQTSKPALLGGELRKWHDRRLSLVTWMEVVRYAEGILIEEPTNLYPAAI